MLKLKPLPTIAVPRMPLRKRVVFTTAAFVGFMLCLAITFAVADAIPSLCA
jgi:hypothetical protein